MRDAGIKIETDCERVTQQQARKPWRTPHIILAEAGDTQTASNLLDDGPSSVS